MEKAASIVVFVFFLLVILFLVGMFLDLVTDLALSHHLKSLFKPKKKPTGQCGNHTPGKILSEVTLDYTTSNYFKVVAECTVCGCHFSYTESPESTLSLQLIYEREKYSKLVSRADDMLQRVNELESKLVRKKDKK